MGGYVDSC
jgi:hypothetical protein